MSYGTESIDDSNSNSLYLADISCESSNDATSRHSVKPEQVLFSSSALDNNNIQNETTAVVSRRQMKRLAKQKKWQEERQKYKAMKKEKQKKRKAELKEKCSDIPVLSRQQLKKMRTEVQPSDIKVAVDFSFDHLMTELNIKKILKQVQHSYSQNRRSNKPLQFYITSFNGASKRLLLETRQGCMNWNVEFREEDFLQVFDKSSVVYLTSDSPNVLDRLESDKVYIIGGLVDHNQHKCLCYNLATEQGVATARLPIDEHIKMKTRKVLTVNHVFSIMLLVAEGCTWTEALLSVIPQRKGAVAKDGEKHKNQVSLSDAVTNSDKCDEDDINNMMVPETETRSENVEQNLKTSDVNSS